MFTLTPDTKFQLNVISNVENSDLVVEPKELLELIRNYGLLLAALVLSL